MQLINKTSVTCAVAGILASYWFYSSQTKKRKQRELEAKNEKEASQYISNLKSSVAIDLLPLETANFMFLSATSTGTFYEGDIPVKPIVQKVKDIFRANPWLAARILRKKEDTAPKAYYDAVFDESTLSKYFEEFYVDNASAEVKLTEKSLDSIFHYAAKHLVKRGMECLNQVNEVCFKVLIFKIKDESSDKVNKTLFVVSLSHVLGDGHTYYHICSFFDLRMVGGKPVGSLNPTRRLQITQQLSDIQGNPYHQSAWFFWFCMKNIFFSFKPDIQTFRVDQQKIKQLKQKYLENMKKNNSAAGPAFLSTNDVLCAWLFERLQCDYAFMVLNCRERLEGYTSDLAGSYTALLPFKKNPDPVTIRETVETFGKPTAPPQPPSPSLWEKMKFKMAMTTNWSSFYSEAILDEDETKYPVLYHCPLISNVAKGFQDTIVIFVMKKGEIGINIMSRTCNHSKDWLSGDTLLKPV
jgi:hypothetical protein